MPLLKEAINQTAYLKAGFLGFEKSGKTRTASELAIGLARDIGDRKPVAFFDTESGSDWMLPTFKTAGIKLLVHKSRTFIDLLEFMDEAEDRCSVAIIDSASHVWEELNEAYRIRKDLEKIDFRDFGPIKTEWAQFTHRYLNSRLHVILCGRAGWKYEHEENDRGKKELIKTDIKMRGEGEMGYEPSLLIEMERVQVAPKKKGQRTRNFIRRAHVLGDRSNIIDGKQFDNPTYADFRPVIEFLNVGGQHHAIDTSRTSQGLFGRSDTSRAEYRRQCEITEEEIKAAFQLASLDGTSNEAKQKRVEILLKCFGTASWIAITQELGLDKMRAGLERVRAELGQTGEVPPAAAAATAPTQPAPPDDVAGPADDQPKTTTSKRSRAK